MRNAIAVISAFCIGATLVGCTTSSNPDTSQPSSLNPATPAARSSSPNNPNTAAAPDWTLKLQSKCPENVSAADCIGFYGFSVDKTGHYQVGPTAAGELRSGAIKPEEVAALEALLQDTLHPATEGSSSLNTGGTEEHASLETPTASDDNIFLSKNTADGQKLIRTNGQDLYFTLKSADQAKALYSAVRKLAEAYYAPMPFPDACEEGIGSMKTLIATATSCKLDADCGYFDSNMNPVAPDAEAVLQLDNCARVLPLSVANTEALKATKSKIQELWGQLQQDCGTKLLRSDCTERTGFKLNKAPATCQEGVCKAPSSLAIVPGTPASFL